MECGGGRDEAARARVRVRGAEMRLRGDRGDGARLQQGLLREGKDDAMRLRGDRGEDGTRLRAGVMVQCERKEGRRLKARDKGRDRDEAMRLQREQR